MSSNPPEYPNYSKDDQKKQKMHSSNPPYNQNYSNPPEYQNNLKDDQKKQKMHSSNPPDHNQNHPSNNPPDIQNFSAYSNQPPSAQQPYQPPPQYQPPPPPYAQPPYSHAQQQQYQSPPPPTAQQPYQPPPYDGQPVTGQPLSGSSRGQWSTGLFDFFDDVRNCVITLLFPCITFGQIAEIVDKGATSCFSSGAMYTLVALFVNPCVYSCTYRSKLRAQYSLLEGQFPDWLVHCFCEPCALCQEYRELKNQGFDMSIGWEGNVDKKRREMMMAPMAQGGMFK